MARESTRSHKSAHRRASAKASAPAKSHKAAVQTVSRIPKLSSQGQSALDRIAPFRRCLWVTRWDFASAADIHKICYNAASARFTDVLFQVRGEGTVFFNSSVEPWAGELSGGPEAVGRNPGWDPLATAVREAHRYGLRLHAYMNVLPGWAHESPPPAASRQLFAAHRSWFMVDANGRSMAPRGFYAFLDPSLPEVRDYLSKLYGEVARKYDVDGIHLDYIRYPDEKGDFSFHPSALSKFKRLFGRRPSEDPQRWLQFRRQQITDTVRCIAQAARQARPGIEISAAVVADPERGNNEACQSALEWVRTGLVDAIAPMAYAGEMNHFDRLCQPYRAIDVRKKVWLGVWADPKRNTLLETEVRRAASEGFGAVAVFSYSELFPAHQASLRVRGVYQAFVSKQSQLSRAD